MVKRKVRIKLRWVHRSREIKNEEMREKLERLNRQETRS